MRKRYSVPLMISSTQYVTGNVLFPYPSRALKTMAGTQLSKLATNTTMKTVLLKIPERWTFVAERNISQELALPPTEGNATDEGRTSISSLTFRAFCRRSAKLNR